MSLVYYLCSVASGVSAISLFVVGALRIEPADSSGRRRALGGTVAVLWTAAAIAAAVCVGCALLGFLDILGGLGGED